MNEHQYRQICAACDAFLDAPGSSFARVAIPWLHVIREHPSFLKNYEELFEGAPTRRKIASRVLRSFRARLGWVRQMWRAGLSTGLAWDGPQEFSQPVDVLFISHLLGSADAENSTDFYFGNLPTDIQARHRTVLVALIDHSGVGGSLNLMRQGDKMHPRIVFSNTLGLGAEWSLLSRLRAEAKHFAKLARVEQSTFLKKGLALASAESISGSARATLRMSMQIGRLVKQVKPRVLVLTYEGHAWERVTFAAAREAHPGIQCVGYQHAAIFRLQHAALRRLGSRFDPDRILSSGLVSKLQMESRNTLADIPVSVLGSTRSRAMEKARGSRTDASRSRTEASLPGPSVCLVIPEGIISECVILFNFSLDCARMLSDTQFIWRLHPSVNFNDLAISFPQFQSLPTNVRFSTGSLAMDLTVTDFALYRGSTAVVNAVCEGVRPIYLEQAGEMIIDPLYELEAFRPKVLNVSDFGKVMGDGLKTQEDEGWRTLVRYCENFYTPLNKQAILELLENPAKKSCI